MFIDSVEHKIRPKTFQLLLTLINANGELVSKDTLLKTVWDDVIVDEQVIFQSVKELRKLFPGQTVIKTVPRKGYAWLPKETLVPTENQSNATSTPKYVLPIALLCLCVLFVVGWISVTKPASKDTVSGSVVVLPVYSTIQTNDHDWVRYGIMDQVISRLSSSENAGVLQTDYVLDVINRAKLSQEDLIGGNIGAIFDVSGAELILAMQLTGSPKDYQIIYTLYQRDQLEKGVVLSSSVKDAADDIAVIVGKRITPDYHLPNEVYSSSFAERLTAEAVEAKSKGDREGALKILHAALVASPQDLVATRLLVQTLVETGAPHQSIVDIASPALALAKTQQSDINLIRIGFWYGLSEALRGDKTKGLALLDEAERIADRNNDWLYLAYIEEIRGQISQSDQRYSQAQRHYQQAMSYHGILHCPLGQSNTLMHLSRLANDQNNHQLALENAQQALAIIESRNLTSKQPAAEQWLRSLTH